MNTDARPTRILMVCTGNICRSTMAHAIAEQSAARAGIPILVDSAGVSDEERGNPIDPRAARVLRGAGYDVPDHRARQVSASELGQCRRRPGADAGSDHLLVPGW